MIENKTQLPVIRKVAVLGSGVMGSQIAAHFANAGMQVLLMDMPVAGKDRNAAVKQNFGKAMKLSPAPLASKKFESQVSFGNFEDHLALLNSVDWILEAIVENLSIKQGLWAKVIENAHPNAILSTNTSGLPIKDISANFPDSAKNRFLGTHFFNPPRYLALFEVIPTPQTNPEILRLVTDFARVQLGKGVVVAKDTPNFIGNRIGTYAMLGHMEALKNGYSVEEIDFLTGPLTGRPKSATFRTADVVGLDTLVHVCRNLYQAIPNDDKRERFAVPELLEKLVASGKLGAKTKAGFYHKKGNDVLSIDASTLDYVAPQSSIFPELAPVSKMKSLADRWRALFSLEGKAGDFIRTYTTDSLWYSAARIPEIADSPADVDNAIKWGFGWEMGPFEIWDAVGFDAVLGQFQKLNLPVPAWISEMKASGKTHFYDAKSQAVHTPKGSAKLHSHADEWTVAQMKSGKTDVWSNTECGLIEIGNDVLLLEFRSKANTMGSQVVAGIDHAVDVLESGHWKALVIGNDGANFTVGANLGEMAQSVQSGDFKEIGKAIGRFQAMVQKVRYAQKPVVTALRGKVLGGGCELSMACAGVAASMESYVGLVELAAGLMPAGTGTMHFAFKAQEKAATEHPSHVQPFLVKAFETVAMAKVSASAFEAIELGYLPENTVVVMRDQRRLEVAKQLALGLANAGYRAPARRNAIWVLGKNGRATLDSAGWHLQMSGFASDYDRFLASRFAYILTGGELTGPSQVSEDYLLQLEKDVFLALLAEKKTQERVMGILTDNKPVRN